MILSEIRALGDRVKAEGGTTLQITLDKHVVEAMFRDAVGYRANLWGFAVTLDGWIEVKYV